MQLCNVMYSETMNKLKQWLHDVIITMQGTFSSFVCLFRVSFIWSPLKVWRHLFTSVGLSEVFMRGWIYSPGVIYRLHQQNVMGYLGTGTFSQRIGRDLPNPLKTHCEGDVALQGVFRWFLFWARQRRRKTKEKWLSWCSITFQSCGITAPSTHYFYIY